jgi:hypothetical protein
VHATGNISASMTRRRSERDSDAKYRLFPVCKIGSPIRRLSCICGIQTHRGCRFSKPDPREKQVIESRAVAVLVMPELRTVDFATQRR